MKCNGNDDIPIFHIPAGHTSRNKYEIRKTMKQVLREVQSAKAA